MEKFKRIVDNISIFIDDNDMTLMVTFTIQWDEAYQYITGLDDYKGQGKKGLLSKL